MTEVSKLVQTQKYLIELLDKADQLEDSGLEKGVNIEDNLAVDVFGQQYTRARIVKMTRYIQSIIDNPKDETKWIIKRDLRSIVKRHLR